MFLESSTIARNFSFVWALRKTDNQRELCWEMILWCIHVNVAQGRDLSKCQLRFVSMIFLGSSRCTGATVWAWLRVLPLHSLVPYSFRFGTFLLHNFFLLLSCPLTHTSKKYIFSNWNRWFLSLSSYLKETSVQEKLQLGHPKGFWNNSFSLMHTSYNRYL